MQIHGFHKTHAASALFMTALMAIASPSHASMNTADMLVNSVKGVKGCLDFKIRGVCTWLKCSLSGCKIRTSFRVQHYVPEVVISTFHDPVRHPWGDYGRLVSTTVSGMGSTILSIPIDSAGSPTPVINSAQYRDADAIGNPVAMLTQVLNGGWPTDIPGTFPVPTPKEMIGFKSQMGSIANQWASLPGDVAGASVAKIKEMADVPAKVASLGSKLTSLPGQISSVANGIQKLPGAITKYANGTTFDGVNFSGVDFGSISGGLGGLGSIFGGGGLGGFDIGGLSESVNKISSVGKIGQLPSIGSLVDLGSLGVSDLSLFCPASSIPFGLHFNSHLDALSWRNVIPVEMIYPQSWVPGMREVGNFPNNTWGPLYPRDGNLTQTHPVKASAVLALRVGNIIDQRNQPHIYAPLVRAGGFRYFNVGQVDETGNKVRWQRLYPNASSSCTKFGTNDSLSVSSFGDNQTTREEGYSWNMWRQYECCKKRGSYIGSVTW
jgi:hypothetical protein